MNGIIKVECYTKLENKRFKLISQELENAILDYKHWKNWQKFDKLLNAKSSLIGNNGVMKKYTTIKTYEDNGNLRTEKVVYTFVSFD